MNVCTRKRLVFGLLVAAVIFGVYMKPWAPIVRPSVNDPTEPAPAVLQQVNAQGAVPGKKDSLVIAFASSWPADPFVRRDAEGQAAETATPVVGPSGPAQWKFQGVITVAGRQVCVINGEQYPIGTMLDGWRIERIEKNEVVLSRGSETIRLTLP